MSNTESQKETAILNEQQSKSKQEIINNIIYILANNNLTISDSQYILHETSKRIHKQKVMFSGVSTGWINANDYNNNVDN